MKIKSSRKLLKNENVSKDASNLKCKKAAVEIKQKFLEVGNLSQKIYCTMTKRNRIYKKDIFSISYSKDYA